MFVDIYSLGRHIARLKFFVSSRRIPWLTVLRRASAQDNQKSVARKMQVIAQWLELTLKKVLGAVEAKDAPTAGAALTTALPIIDKMVTKGIMHKNQAARHKSRLTKKVKALAEAS